jgi:hypothetical protein
MCLVYALNSYGTYDTERAETCVSACNFDPLSRGIGVQN